MSHEPTTASHVVNLNALARVLGMSLPTARAFVRDNDLPVLSRGRQGKAWRFDLDAVLAWCERTQAAADGLSLAQMKAYWESVRVADQVRLSRRGSVERAPEMALLKALLGVTRRPCCPFYLTTDTSSL